MFYVYLNKYIYIIDILRGFDIYTIKFPRLIEIKNIYFFLFMSQDNTTYKLSYYESGCGIPVSRSFKPKKIYTKSDVPMDGCTTYKLSYWPYETPCKVFIPRFIFIYSLLINNNQQEM